MNFGNVSKQIKLHKYGSQNAYVITTKEPFFVSRRCWQSENQERDLFCAHCHKKD